MQNEPGAQGLLEKIVLWLMALVAYLTRSASNRPAATRSRRAVPRNHTAPLFEVPHNSPEPESFDWELRVSNDAECA